MTMTPHNPYEKRDGDDAATIAESLAEIHAELDKITSSPWSHDVLELAMAVATCLPLSEREKTSPVWLMIVGPPSGDKTHTVQLLRRDQQSYYADSVTENFLASGYKDAKGKRAPNMLTELNGKTLIIKDLTTMFSLPHEKAKKFLGDLQSVYDGEYRKLTGTVGAVGGTARFTMLCCVTPSSLSKHHRYMSEIGSRFLHYRIPPLTREQQQDGYDKADRTDRRATTDRLGTLVCAHLEKVRALPEATLSSDGEWGVTHYALDTLAEFVARGRAVISWCQDRGALVMGAPQIEEPFRIREGLSTLARAVARVHGRASVDAHDLALVSRVAQASIDPDRATLLTLAAAHPEGVQVTDCCAATGRSEDWASRTLNELVQLELLRRDESGPSEEGRGPGYGTSWSPGSP